MPESDQIWRPGSFTKNFSWGRDGSGLLELYEVLRAGFSDRLEDVSRALFRERVQKSNRPDYIPINFFLFNAIVDGENVILVDELVFQALAWPHSPAFDKVALFAFLFSYAGKWKGASSYQRRPALWANAYVSERVATSLLWDTSKINADDIQDYVQNDPRYRAETSRKLSTNLNYLLRIGRLHDFSNTLVTRWWVDCLFLALDRLISDAMIDGSSSTKHVSGQRLLMQSSFFDLTGGKTLEKDLAVNHLVRLYSALGGRKRFFDDWVVQRTKQTLPEVSPIPPNDPRPQGAIHRTNASILKSIPPICSKLAKTAGFEVISPSELDEFELGDFAHRRAKAALALLRERGIRPTMTLEELLSMTREK